MLQRHFIVEPAAPLDRVHSPQVALALEHQRLYFDVYRVARANVAVLDRRFWVVVWV